MSANMINVSGLCGPNIYTRADGKVLYDEIARLLDLHGQVVVDFEGKIIASESFMDEAVVEHYLHPLESRNPAECILLRSVSKSDRVLLDRIYAYRKKLEEKIARRERSASTKT